MVLFTDVDCRRRKSQKSIEPDLEEASQDVGGTVVAEKTHSGIVHLSPAKSASRRHEKFQEFFSCGLRVVPGNPSPH